MTHLFSVRSSSRQLLKQYSHCIFSQLIQIPELCCRQEWQHPSNVKTWILLSSCQKIQLYYTQCLILQSLFLRMFYLINDFDTVALEPKLLQCNCFLQGDREQGVPSMACSTFASSLGNCSINLCLPKSHGRACLLPSAMPRSLSGPPWTHAVLKPLL